MKRTDYISWDEYFMGVALLAARRSKDPNTQVGACIVSPDNIILSTGYNGLPCSCSDDVFPWEREGAETKYPYVVHAELNAILNAGGRVLRGARLYVALFPCNECAKAIIQSGIREIIYFSDKYAETPFGLLPLKFFFSGGYESSGGESLSSESVKNKIKKIVDEESPRSPLSDSKIAEILAEDGVAVARRTVAKYRDELGIAPKNLRKRF